MKYESNTKTERNKKLIKYHEEHPNEPLENVDKLLNNLELYRARCLKRKDLYFSQVFEEYLHV